nr:hypothetical protein Iba_chr09dCG0040 [Ipomoea batatas]
MMKLKIQDSNLQQRAKEENNPKNQYMSGLINRNEEAQIRCHTSYGIDDCCWEGCPHIAVGTWTCC